MAQFMPRRLGRVVTGHFAFTSKVEGVDLQGYVIVVT